MMKMGFDSRWIQLLMMCIKSVSPYLFIFCVEALSVLLQKAKRFKKITRVPIARGRVRINHLFLRRW